MAIPRKFSHVGNYQWKHQILCVCVCVCREQAEKRGSKRAQSLTQAKWVLTRLLTYLPTGASDLFSSSIFRSENSNFQADSSNLQTRPSCCLQIVHAEKSAENGLKFGPLLKEARPLPPLVKKIRIDESDKILLFWFMIPEAAAAAAGGWIVVVSSYQE